MSVLSNPKHERFAQGLAKGMTATAAYAMAGYKRDGGNAARLTGNDRIKARVAEIQSKAAEKAATFLPRSVPGHDWRQR